MAETTQQEVQAKVEDANAKQPEFILTKSGVMIIGSELIGDKLTALLAEAIVMNESSGLSTVVFRDDGFPADEEGKVFAMSYADTMSFAVNLEHCWDRAVEIAKSGEKYLSLLGLLWVNVLSCYGHEIDHIDLAYGDRELFEQMRNDEEGHKDLETAAKETAQRLILRLALKYDTEIPAIEGLGTYFSTKWMELMTGDLKDEEWVVKARKMAEEGIIYEEPENDIKLETFREFVKQAYPGSDKEDWDQPTTAVNIEVHMEDGRTEMLMAEPVEEPQVEAVELEQEIIEAADETQNIQAVEMPAEVGATLFATAAAAGGAPIESAPAELTVPLPAPVQETVDHAAAAAQTNVPPAPYSEPTYQAECNLAPEMQPAFMQAVWQTVYHHIFTKCGWTQNPQSGRFMFTNAAAVLEGVNIQHLIQQFGADNFIMEYETHDAAGKGGHMEQCQGMLRGYLTSKQGLPAYCLYLNINGQRFKRSFLPQNPEKMTNNAYTNSANDAAAGNMISWVFKGEVSDQAPFKEKCSVKIRNNEYEIIS